MPSPPRLVPVILRTKTGERTYYVKSRAAARANPKFVRFTRTKRALATAAQLSQRTQRTQRPDAPTRPGPKGTTQAGADPKGTTRAGAGPGRAKDRAGGDGADKRVVQRTLAPLEADLGGEFRRLRGAVYSTQFKAFGTVGNVVGFSPEYSRDLVNSRHPSEGAPAEWYSNQGRVLGQVKFDGIVAERELLELVNSRLQLRGMEREGFDFRAVYPTWEYRYSVVETIGVLDRVVVDRVRRGR